MFIIGVRKCLATTGWRFFYHDSGRQFVKKNTKLKTSGIIVTGDEVLKGQVLDTNSHFLCKNLYEMGIKVLSISTVADNLDALAEEVKRYSQKYDYVLTSGGIGPTHDDITFEAVAKAFDEKLHYHPELFKIILNFYKTNDVNHPALKMALIPETARVTYGIDSVTKKKAFYPNVSLRNVYMFPGVPVLCERLFNNTKSQLFDSFGHFYVRELYLSQNEGLIVQQLNNAVKKFPNVIFGSYPKYFHSYYNVKITIESIDESESSEAFDYLQSLIPKNFHVEYDKNPFVDKHNKLNKIKSVLLEDTLKKIENLCKENNPNDIFIFFDGSINSTALLHILSAVYEKLYPKLSINAIYVEINSKINNFINQSVKNYNLNILKLTEDNFINFAMCSSKIRVIRGIRKSEPNYLKVLKSFGGIEIVNPLLDWSYSDVWNIIKSLCLPYCELYDQGYTSINDVDSKPNPNLITTGPRSDLIYYKKAFELENDILESAK